MRKTLTGLLSQASHHHSYRSMRAYDISLVFAFTILVQDLIQYPRAGWTAFAVMTIYVGFDNGTALFRAYHRFLGVMIGICLSYFIWIIVRCDYRLMILVMPAIIFFGYFFTAHVYSIPTVFSVVASIIGTGYFDVANSFPTLYYMIDYGICTIIAFAIVWAFEYFWFGHYHMLLRFVNNTQADVLGKIIKLNHLLTKHKIRRSDWFKACISFTESLSEINNLIRNAEFEVSSERIIGDEFNQFVELSNQIFIGQKALYLAHNTKRFRKYDYHQLFRKIRLDLEHLKIIISETRFIDASEGIVHETSP